MNSSSVDFASFPFKFYAIIQESNFQVTNYYHTDVYFFSLFILVIPYFFNANNSKQLMKNHDIFQTYRAQMHKLKNVILS